MATMILLMGATASATPVKVGKLPYIREQFFGVEVGGGKLQLHIMNYRGRNVKFHSMNPKIAKVNKTGLVTGKRKGTTYIVAKCGKVQCLAKCYVSRLKGNLR